MSIYISGLEFPKVPTFIILLPDGQVEIPSQARMAKAMPVPEHGRLIDGDALAQKCDDPYWCVWLSDIEDAPTIIPASGGNENE